LLHSQIIVRQKGKPARNQRVAVICTFSKKGIKKVEAKLQWVHIDTKTESVEKVLESARDDAERLLPQKYRAAHYAGLLFAVMSLKKDQAKTFDPNIFNLFKRKFREVESDFCWLWYDSEFSSYSWYDKKTYTDEEEKDDRFHPGLAVFLRLARP
jgi:hypothetical protein